MDKKVVLSYKGNKILTQAMLILDKKLLKTLKITEEDNIYLQYNNKIIILEKSSLKNEVVLFSPQDELLQFNKNIKLQLAYTNKEKGYYNYRLKIPLVIAKNMDLEKSSLVNLDIKEEKIYITKKEEIYTLKNNEKYFSDIKQVEFVAEESPIYYSKYSDTEKLLKIDYFNKITPDIKLRYFLIEKAEILIKTQADNIIQTGKILTEVYNELKNRKEIEKIYNKFIDYCEIHPKTALRLRKRYELYKIAPNDNAK